MLTKDLTYSFTYNLDMFHNNSYQQKHDINKIDTYSSFILQHNIVLR